MKKALYKICRRLYFRHLLPWAVWSWVYDNTHKALTIEEKYSGGGAAVSEKDHKPPHGKRFPA